MNIPQIALMVPFSAATAGGAPSSTIGANSIVGREEFQGEAPALRGDAVAHERAPVLAHAIPDHEDLAADVPQQMLEEDHHLRALDGSREHPEVEVPPRHPGDGRERVPIEMELEHRGLTARCPVSDPVRPLAQPTFVNEDDRLPLARGALTGWSDTCAHAAARIRQAEPRRTR